MNDTKNDLIKQRLLKGLIGLKKCFKKGELAYLTLTSKPEFVIRDRLAWELHKRLDPGYIVAREWTLAKSTRRIDLAILDDFEAKALVEVKAVSWPGFRGHPVKTH